VAFVEAYVRTGSIRETHGILGDKFPGRGTPAKRAIHTLVKKWRAMGSVHNAPKQRAPAFRMPKVIEDIRRSITQSPKKSTHKLAQQTHVSRRTCQRVLKSLHLNPYCVTVEHHLKEANE
jgi:AraC-like DNA-binding protein